MFKCSFEFHPNNLLCESEYVAALSFQICAISHINHRALDSLDQHEAIHDEYVSLIIGWTLRNNVLIGTRKKPGGYIYYK